MLKQVQHDTHNISSPPVLVEAGIFYFSLLPRAVFLEIPLGKAKPRAVF